MRPFNNRLAFSAPTKIIKIGSTKAGWRLGIAIGTKPPWAIHGKLLVPTEAISLPPKCRADIRRNTPRPASGNNHQRPAAKAARTT